MEVYYFDKPTIGYCPDCNASAIYTDRLRCPNNTNHNLSIFVWDEQSRHPEWDEEDT